MKTQKIGRIEKALNVIKELEVLKFSEKNLRGLSKLEKEFIIENNYNVFLSQNGWDKKSSKIYMFIAKNKLGKKQLYGITKAQSVNPNGHDVSKSAYNFECWLLFDAKYGKFSRFEYERRHTQTPNVRLIFA